MKPFAVFTVVQNESLFLRLWCNYYCRLSKSVDVFVLDDSSTDGSVDLAKSRYPDLSVSAIASGEKYDLGRLRRSVQAFQRELLKEYEVVIYTDVDEILLTMGPEGLFPYLRAFLSGTSLMVRATGWHCVHAAGERSLSLTEGERILEDRKHVLRLTRYDKVLISKVPLTWTNGFHGCLEAQSLNPDPELVLFHAWMVDRDAFVQKDRTYARQGPARLAASYGLGRSPTGLRLSFPEIWKDLLFW